LRFPFWMQALLVGMLGVALALIVTDVVDDWTDWIVLGVIIVTVFATAAAVMNRRYPTRKRAFTRDSDSNW
jgi:nicotinamide riboside transporter PnuC